VGSLEGSVTVRATVLVRSRLVCGYSAAARGNWVDGMRWLRIGGRFGAERVRRPGLPSAPLPQLRQAVQRAQCWLSEPDVRHHRPRGALTAAPQAQPARPAGDVSDPRHRVRSRGGPRLGSKLTPALAEGLRRRQRGEVGRSSYVDETLHQGTWVLALSLPAPSVARACWST
jgi:hypothetical protein